MKVVYVAGPIRAKTAWEIEQNIRKAEETAAELLKLGVMPICPHSMFRFVREVVEDSVFLKGDLEILKHCDAMLVVGDYINSKGTMGEIKFAEENNIPVRWSINDLIGWVQEE